jgi:hypothetical protein
MEFSAESLGRKGAEKPNFASLRLSASALSFRVSGIGIDPKL